MKFTKCLSIAILLCSAVQVSKAQIKSQIYSFQHDQKYNDLLYSPSTRYHTAVKPYVLKGELLNRFDSLQNANQMDSQNWFLRKIFNEHLVDVKKDDHTFFLDFLPDFVMGKEMFDTDKRTTWLNTRGFQAGLTIGDKFTFYANAFENQGVFPRYLDEYVTRNEVMPGQGSVEHAGKKTKDWMYATASLTYDFSDYLQATLAYDKNHIGDGYRSLLLSDFSSNYTHLKLSGKIGNVQYTSIWAYMTDPKNPRIDSLNSGGRFGDGIKWGAFQYLDYNATNRLSIGFFQAVVWANKNEAGHRGFDFNYLNPVIFLRPVESNNSTSPDKMFLGLNAKYKVLDNMTAYGQFLLGEFTAKEFFGGKGYAHNKWGTQLGVKGFDLFKVKRLNFLAEYNVVRPYTYQHFTSISNYSNHGEPLAHPRGANFKELVGIANYSWKRFDFSLQGLYSVYGTDPADGTNMGGDIFQSYLTIPHTYGNSIGQGIKHNLFYADAKAAYVLNPKYNLRFEVGYTQRFNRVEDAPTEKSGVITFGLRSSFRNFYGDM
ncbi:gliding motility protein RemB [Sphingobacterium psychroaquaticum]|uniref:gliding motility protein RemB n=1 Tax=Sphingobacterium psychroaquaticum TaxID=561061 RepID=UPI00106B8E81|nr:gliding motility protein RemB [Sphingobacterium psychroaquaticum]QBQ42133.1 gliding motility protein RemB [Sphingobacterium psychroaquaticum]